jgi:galactokinase
MFKPIHGTVSERTDTAAFIASLAAAKHDKSVFFNHDGPVIVSRAPGRLDVMGGMADYSGATVFEATTAEATHCAVQVRPDTRVLIVSEGSGEGAFRLQGSFDLSLLKKDGKAIRYRDMRASYFTKETEKWLRFIFGAYAVIHGEGGFEFKSGANIYISSTVPMGKGISSSAALEISLLKSIIEAYGIPAGHRDIPYWAHRLENFIVGSPCGMMDQYASSHGLEGHLLPVVCQPDNVLDPVPIEDDIIVVGVETGLRSRLTKQNYADVRAAAFMGYRIIAEILGLKVTTDSENPHHVFIDDPHFDGYLANIQTSRFDVDFRSELPFVMSGQDFIDKYDGITDLIVKIDPQKEYKIRSVCKNQVYENLRTVLFLQLLRAYTHNRNEQLLISLGELMFLSHRAYTLCELGDAKISTLVHQIRMAGPRVGLYGAKISGSGTGGTVTVLLKKTALPVLQKMVNTYATDIGTNPRFYIGNSAGALEFDHLKLKWFA